jgi:hypothetical protein
VKNFEKKITGPQSVKTSLLYRVISPSGIADLCGTVARMVTPKGGMLTL